MISELRKATARANGARSKGPKTAEGKRKSSRNSLKHGLYATNAFILDESPELFARHLEAFLNDYRPQTPRARALVYALAVAAWLVARCPQVEASFLNRECDKLEALAPTADPTLLALRAYNYLSDNTNLLDLLGHCESRYNRMFDRAWRLLSKELSTENEITKIGQRTKLFHAAQPAPPAPPTPHPAETAHAVDLAHIRPPQSLDFQP